MEKDFDAWNIQKKAIHDRNELVRFRPREVWWCALGVNVGFEEDGKHANFERPVLIIKKFNQDTLWALPLIRAAKAGRFYYPMRMNNSVAIISQLRLVSSKRLLRRMRIISHREFRDILAATVKIVLAAYK